MKYTEIFIKKAMEGGWKKGWRFDHCDGVFVYMEKTDATCKQPIVAWMLDRVFLDTKSWQAVGKVEEWGIKPFKGSLKESMGRTIFIGLDGCEVAECQYRMHGLIDALWGDKMVEQYLETLFKG